MASAFMRHGGARGADAAAPRDADVLAARTRRFENERNIVAKQAVPKKTMAWAGGSITSNKEAALKKFLARKAANGVAVDPALLRKAMEARGERAAVAVDPPKESEDHEGDDARRGENRDPPQAPAKPFSSGASAQHHLKQNNPSTSKAAKKYAKRNAKTRGANNNNNAQVAAEIHASLFR